MSIRFRKRLIILDRDQNKSSSRVWCGTTRVTGTVPGGGF